ncbi:peptide ABC transporter substrate-binding protein [Candidatus Leptofilum sp.]|uniref:peptide ABC transporter substrate-binding protein n=1 Tax=Candidatus Leptofilum sp. TaxID=3241576 RepID=UPI003B5C634D
MRTRKPILLLLLLMTLVACQTEPGPARQVAQWVPDAPEAYRFAETPTPIPNPTGAPIPTLEPTPTAVTDLIIPTRAATAVPDGVYVRERDGLQLIYPTSWIVEAELDTIVAFRDPGFNLVVTIDYDLADEYDSFEALRDDILGELGEELGLDGVQIISEQEATFAGDIPAQRAIFSGEDANGQPIGLYLAYAFIDERYFLLSAFGSPENVNARLTTLDAILEQVSPDNTTLYGLNREETLILLGGDPFLPSLDPARTTGSAAGYVGLLYSGLVRLTPDLQIVPDLAERWDVSEDGTVYTFTLREGLTFADGRPLTAVDVKYSWERATNPLTESRTAATYLGDIVGVPDRLAGSSHVISGLEVIDDTTLVVTLDGPKPYFLAKLTYPTSYIVDRRLVHTRDLDDWALKPNGSGPYSLLEYREGEVMIFVRNPEYHTPPAVANVLYYLDFVDPLTLFKSGTVDQIFLGSLEAQDVRRPSNPLNAQLVSGTSMCTSLIQMNNSLAPFDDVQVRRAFALAVDKDAYNNIIADGLDVRADTILPPAMPGYSLSLAQAQADLHANAELAVAALAASSYADALPPVVLSVAGSSSQERDDLNAMIQNWREILGAEVTIEYVPPTNFTNSLRQNESHMAAYGWCADYPDPQNFLDILYHSESDFNVANFDDPEIDALLEQARVELDVATRLALYQSIETRLIDEAVAIPMLHGVTDVLVTDRVEGYVLAPIGANFVPYVSLNAEAGEGE